MTNNPPSAAADGSMPQLAKKESMVHLSRALGKGSNTDPPQNHRAMVPIHPNGEGSETQFSSSSRPSVVGQHFRVGKKIGEGSFGTIYEGNRVSCDGICFILLPDLL